MTGGRLRCDITTMATEPPAGFRALVELVEGAGFDALWVCDSSLHARDVYVTLAQAAGASRRLGLGPNCTHPYTRHPGVTANALASLDELSGGRARLAIGAGDRPVGELGHRPAPVATVRAMVAAVRRLLAGETVDAGGPVALRGARLTVPAPRLPIYLAASGPAMLELAGEVADGVLFFSGVAPAGVAFAREHVGRGAARAGRDPAGLDVGCTVAGSLRDDRARARQECVPLAAWFPQTAPVYAELAGVEPERVRRIREAYAGGHFDAAGRAFAHVSDAMVDAFTVAGGPEVWVERLSQLVAGGVRHLNIFLLSADRPAMVRLLADKVLPQLPVPA